MSQQAKLLLVSDAWSPQTNGVVRCLKSIRRELQYKGMRVRILAPNRFWRVPLPSYPDIQLAMNAPGEVGQFINRARADYIHIATEGPLGLQARLYCEWNNLPFTTSYHTRFPEYLAARAPVPMGVSYAYLRWFHWESQGVLAPTQSVVDELRFNGFRRVKTWTRGVDHAHFRPGPKTGILQGEGPHLLYVGRLAVEKNIEAFLALKVRGTKFVVGSGPERPRLEKLYPEARFLGPKFGTELAEIYRNADVFVFPSKTDTFGNVMLEALASGVPVAAYDVTGPKDVLTDPACGAIGTDLNQSVMKALGLDRIAAVAHASRFTWAHCAAQFVDNLAIVKRENRGLEAA